MTNAIAPSVCMPIQKTKPKSRPRKEQVVLSRGRTGPGQEGKAEPDDADEIRRDVAERGAPRGEVGLDRVRRPTAEAVAA